MSLSFFTRRSTTPDPQAVIRTLEAEIDKLHGVISQAERLDVAHLAMLHARDRDTAALTAENDALRATAAERTAEAALWQGVARERMVTIERLRRCRKVAA